jgi:hypothetical protein
MSDDQITIEYPEPFYSLFNTSRGELPAITFVNAALREFAHRDLFPWHLSVLIWPVAMAEHGMPAREEVAALDAVGDEIHTAITGERNALFLARETWNGRRQLLFQVHDPDVADTSLQQLIARGTPQREWEFRMEHDAPWTLAEPFLALLANATSPKA